MTQSNKLLEPFALGGYRSFGSKVQIFENFSKINLFIGQNNSGKSNILQFIHDIYPTLSTPNALQLEPLDKHFPSNAQFMLGMYMSLEKDCDGNYAQLTEKVNPKISDDRARSTCLSNVIRVLLKKAELDKTNNAWFYFSQDKKLMTKGWETAFKTLNDNQINGLWMSLTRHTGGGREQHWYPDTLKALTPSFPSITSVLIPAIRQVGRQGSTSDDFSGEGIIERLIKLQNPDVHSQGDRAKFDSINRFLQNVTDNYSATIEVPHERDTILVHMDGKTLPLESLGTGIHEVIILASAATILENTVICMEEPELHLNPTLQKKLVRYLETNTNNQYFITTHSAALMDTPNSEVYHVKLDGGQSIVNRVTSDKHRSEICEDLGYHPSDLLQANCIIWVEGPSDRIYINYWIKKVASQLTEGIQYSIMFYGGRLASHLSGSDISSPEIENFISLRSINRNAVIVIDSDKGSSRSHINQTKKRLRDEFNKGPGFAWITKGREVENYIRANVLQEAIRETKPSATSTSSFGDFENALSIKTRGGKKAQASKVDVAKYIASNFEVDFTPLDLNKKMKELIGFISNSNPTLHK